MVVAILGALVTGDVVEALAVIVVVMGGDRVRDWGMQTVATMLQDAGGRLAPQVPSFLTGRNKEKGAGCGHETGKGVLTCLVDVWRVRWRRWWMDSRCRWKASR